MQVIGYLRKHKSLRVKAGERVRDWSAALQLMIVGFYVPLSMLIPTGLGFWLDRKASHGFPLYTIIGLGVGTVIMVYGVYRMVRPFLRESEQEGKEDQISRPKTTVVGLLASKRKMTTRRDNG